MRWGCGWGGEERHRQKGREKEGVSKFKVLPPEISSSVYKVPMHLCYPAWDPMGKCIVSCALSKVLQVKTLIYICNLENEENFIKRHFCLSLVGWWDGWAFIFLFTLALN